jgi:hypothetical protein
MTDARQHCNVCGDTESMPHILTQCESAPVQLIWNACEELLAARPHQMTRYLSRHHPGLRHDHCPPPQNDDTEHSQTARGLLQILISESAHLIWVLRCERAMQNKSHTAQEARARWLRQINIRLTDDKIIPTKVKRDKASTRLVKDLGAAPSERYGTPNRLAI